jgi:uncharacterized protein YceH (UPF0502 family)
VDTLIGRGLAEHWPGRVEQLEAEVAALRTELAELRKAFEAFRDQF